jgi:hypothetical protein
MVGHQHLPIGFDSVTLAIFLGEFAHLKFGIVDLDGLFEECLACFALRPSAWPASSRRNSP